MFYVLALASAACYGAADFLGGIASRRGSTIVIVLVSQGAGLLLMAGLLLFQWSPPPMGRDFGFLWGTAAGLAGGIGVALLYQALAVGTMAVVAPVTAVCAVVVPVIAAILASRWPSSRSSW
jgi:uncharacterized membrane protein